MARSRNRPKNPSPIEYIASNSHFLFSKCVQFSDCALVVHEYDHYLNLLFDDVLVVSMWWMQCRDVYVTSLYTCCCRGMQLKRVLYSHSSVECIQISIDTMCIHSRTAITTASHVPIHFYVHLPYTYSARHSAIMQCIHIISYFTALQCIMHSSNELTVAWIL